MYVMLNITVNDTRYSYCIKCEKILIRFDTVNFRKISCDFELSKSFIEFLRIYISEVTLFGLVCNDRRLTEHVMEPEMYMYLCI
jgi:hypothetical protein